MWEILNFDVLANDVGDIVEMWVLIPQSLGIA